MRLIHGIGLDTLHSAFRNTLARQDFVGAPVSPSVLEELQAFAKMVPSGQASDDAICAEAARLYTLVHEDAQRPRAKGEGYEPRAQAQALGDRLAAVAAGAVPFEKPGSPAPLQP